MMNFRDYCQQEDSLNETLTNDRAAMEAAVQALKPVFRRYSRETSLNVVRALSTPKGQELLRGLIHNPSRSISKFRQLM